MNKILITSIFTFLTLCNIINAQMNVNTIVVWDGVNYNVYLSNGSAPQTISFSGFNLDIDAPNGTSLAIGTNPYGLALDVPAPAGGIFTYVKPGTTTGVMWTTANPGDLILQLIPSGPNIVSQTAVANQYVEFAGVDRTASLILPIIIKSFDVVKYNEKAAKLNWVTSLEINSDYFDIERSENGKNWEKIGNVNATENSNVDVAYEFFDNTLPLNRSKDQIFYYRLRLTDLDGAFKYSDVRGINFGRLPLGPITIYPNPTTEQVNVDLSNVNMESGKVDIMVYDLKGQLVDRKSVV